MEGAQNHQVQYQKPTFSGLKGQQKRSGVAGPRPALLFEMENRRFSLRVWANETLSAQAPGGPSGRPEIDRLWVVSRFLDF